LGGSVVGEWTNQKRSSDMAKYMNRITALRNQYLGTRVEMDVFNAKYLTEGFKETEGQPWIIQKATGYLNQCRKKKHLHSG
jgi:formate C-acetyltransferase